MLCRLRRRCVNAGCSRPAPRVSLARAFPGPRPSGSLRLLKFDPVEFVFARAKTILPGAKLGAQSAPAGPAPRMARAKETKESTPPGLRTLAIPRSPLRACPSAARGARLDQGGLKNPVGASRAPFMHRDAMRWRFSDPVAAAEHRRRNREKRASCLSPRRVVQHPASWGERRFRREAREAVGGSGVSFLLVTFLWTSKEKLPAVGQPPTSSFSSSPKAIRQKRAQGRCHPQIAFKDKSRLSAAFGRSLSGLPPPRE
jgi:hypothetical protein